MMHRQPTRLLIVAIAIAAGPITSAPAQAQQPDWYSLRTVNFPAHYIRHANFLVGIAAITDEQVRDDATWRVRPGLTGACITFEAVNFPGHFLRHQNFRVTLARHDGSAQFATDATFCVAPGMTGTGQSYFAVNMNQYYLRHRNFELWLDRFDGTDQFRQDATFLRVAPVRF